MHTGKGEGEEGKWVARRDVRATHKHIGACCGVCLSIRPARMLHRIPPPSLPPPHIYIYIYRLSRPLCLSWCQRSHISEWCRHTCIQIGTCVHLRKGCDPAEREGGAQGRSVSCVLSSRSVAAVFLVCLDGTLSCVCVCVCGYVRLSSAHLRLLCFVVYLCLCASACRLQGASHSCRIPPCFFFSIAVRLALHSVAVGASRHVLRAGLSRLTSAVALLLVLLLGVSRVRMPGLLRHIYTACVCLFEWGIRGKELGPSQAHACMYVCPSSSSSSRQESGTGGA